MTRRAIRQEIYYDNGTQEQLTAATSMEGIYAFAWHDWQTKFYFRKKDRYGNWGYSVPRQLQEDKDEKSNEKGYPEMVPFGPRVGVRLTEELQWWWMAQLVWSRYRIEIFEYEDASGRTVTAKEQFYTKLSREQQDFMKEAWRQLTRDDTAFMNGTGTSSKSGKSPAYKDFIRGTGINELPILWENGCGGSTYKVAYKEVYPEMESIELYTLKVSEYKKWRAAKFDDPLFRCFFTYGTNITPFKVGTINTVTYTGPWKVDPMHMLGGAQHQHVPVPLISYRGIVTVAADRVKIIRNMAAYPHNYNP